MSKDKTICHTGVMTKSEEKCTWHFSPLTIIAYKRFTVWTIANLPAFISRIEFLHVHTQLIFYILCLKFCTRPGCVVRTAWRFITRKYFTIQRPRPKATIQPNPCIISLIRYGCIVIKGGQVSVVLSADPLCFIPGLTLIHKLIMERETWGEDAEP